MSGKPQPKPQKRKKDKHLLQSIHLERPDCVLAGNECEGRIEIHHVLGGSNREDHVSNTTTLCTSHHKKITDNDVEVRVELGAYLLAERPDVLAYIRGKFGAISGDDWLRRRLFIGV